MIEHSQRMRISRAIRAEASTAQLVVVESYPDADWQQALAASQLESF